MDLPSCRKRCGTTLPWALSLLACAIEPARAAGLQVDDSQPYAPRLWPSTPPPDCPFEPSDEIAGVRFTGRHREYTRADCWFPSWASDGYLYSPFSDGTVENVMPDGKRESIRTLGAKGPDCSVGYGKIVGDDPLNLEVIGLGALPTEAAPYESRYPSGSLVHDEHSPDGKAYLTAHGATERRENPQELNSSWCIGDHAFLLRVTPSPETLNDPRAYEFFAGHDADGRPLWTDDFSKIRPLLSWKGRVGCAAMTYNPGRKTYLFCITDGRAANGPYDTYILESPTITGPWRLVVFMEAFGPQGYFVNIPSKFIREDGRTAWLCYAANFSAGGPHRTPLESNPPGSRYGLNLQEIVLTEE